MSYLREEGQMLEWKEDGLRIIETGEYALEKYRLLSNYLSIFST